MHGVLTWALALGAAAAPDYPPQVFPASGITGVVISGVRGRVVVRGAPASARSYRLRVAHPRTTGDDWGLSVERRGHRLVIEVFSTALGREWRPLIDRDRWPTFDIELSGPAVPLVIGWRDGSLDVADWPATVDATLLGGRARVARVGALDLQLARGDASVRELREPTRVRGEAGRLDLDDVRGPTRVDWLSGRIDLRRLRADLDLSGHDLVVSAADGAGRWRLEVPRGRVALDGFAGELNGRGDSSAWRVTAQTSTLLDLVSRSGVLEAPLKAVRAGRWRRVRGQVGAPRAGGRRTY